MATTVYEREIGFDDPGTKEMLGVFDRFQTLRNNSQQNATTCNRLCKRTQHAKSNNVGSFWPAMLCPFARGLRCRSCLLALKRMTLQALQKVSRQTHPESLTLLCYLFVCIQAELDQYCSALLEAGADLTPLEFIKKWK